MKNIFTLAFAFFFTGSLFAQAPEKMSYQAVVRDGSNDLVINQTVGMQISILQGAVSGTSVYTETQTPTTNSNGLVSLEIGSGTSVSGTFSAIDWSAGTYFIKTETDPNGGTNYTITGTSQLMSVPYALYAKTSGNGEGPQGPAGADGSTGPQGAQGLQGLKGDDGSTGSQGAQGIQGLKGDDGSAGSQGSQGPAGTPYTPPIYNVNTNYAELGGYVIAVRDGGKHGLVVAMQDQGNSPWYEANDLLSDANNHDVNGAKFMDWRLPTKRELNLVYNQQSNIGGFASYYYWSSMEYDNSSMEYDNGTAWEQDFEDGSQNSANKGYGNYVRAVRAF